ncbi:MAG: hypothetical protein AAB364_02820 [Patescibacteria group bacterium]
MRQSFVQSTADYAAVCADIQVHWIWAVAFLGGDEVGSVTAQTALLGPEGPDHDRQNQNYSNDLPNVLR